MCVGDGERRTGAGASLIYFGVSLVYLLIKMMKAKIKKNIKKKKRKDEKEHCVRSATDVKGGF